MLPDKTEVEGTRSNAGQYVDSGRSGSLQAAGDSYAGKIMRVHAPQPTQIRSGDRAAKYAGHAVPYSSQGFRQPFSVRHSTNRRQPSYPSAQMKADVSPIGSAVSGRR